MSLNNAEFQTRGIVYGIKIGHFYAARYSNNNNNYNEGSVSIPSLEHRNRRWGKAHFCPVQQAGQNIDKRWSLPSIAKTMGLGYTMGLADTMGLTTNQK